LEQRENLGRESKEQPLNTRDNLGHSPAYVVQQTTNPLFRAAHTPPFLAVGRVTWPLEKRRPAGNAEKRMLNLCRTMSSALVTPKSYFKRFFN